MYAMKTNLLFFPLFLIPFLLFSQKCTLRGRVVGTYQDSAWIFGAQASMSF